MGRRSFFDGVRGRPGSRNKKMTGSEEPVKFGGRYRTRTCDLLHVKQMLYQLS